MNLQLPNDEVKAWPILELNQAGNVVTALAGDSFTIAVADSTKLNATIANINGKVCAQFNALVDSASGVGFTVSDADGLAAFVGAVDIIEDLTPSAIGLDLANAVVVGAQPVPAASSSGTINTAALAATTGLATGQTASPPAATSPVNSSTATSSTGSVVSSSLGSSAPSAGSTLSSNTGTASVPSGS